MKRRTVVLAAAGIMTGLGAPASAYVRTRTSAGVPTAWKSPCVTMEFALGTVPPALDAAAYLDAAQQGGAAWTQASLDGANRCSNVLLAVEATTDVAGSVGKDGHNRIIFRQNEWCRDPPPAEPSEPGCYDPSALVMTTVFQSKSSGAILDADIELNAKYFTWVDLVTEPDGGSITSHDFQGAMTHEFGHALGLEHNCYTPVYSQDGTALPAPVDHTGTPVPQCGPDNSPSITDATMYVSVDSSTAELGLRTLSPDDIQGVCDIYPYSPTFVCGSGADDGPAGGKGGGCSLGHGSGSIAVALALAALGLGRARSRRDRRYEMP